MFFWCFQGVLNVYIDQNRVNKVRNYDDDNGHHGNERKNKRKIYKPFLSKCKYPFYSEDLVNDLTLH